MKDWSTILSSYDIVLAELHGLSIITNYDNSNVKYIKMIFMKY